MKPIKKPVSNETKLTRTKLPSKTKLNKLVEDMISETSSVYLHYYNIDIQESEKAAFTLKKINEKKDVEKYAKYKL